MHDGSEDSRAISVQHYDAWAARQAAMLYTNAYIGLSGSHGLLYFPPANVNDLRVLGSIYQASDVMPALISIAFVLRRSKNTSRIWQTRIIRTIALFKSDPASFELSG